ncbi:MAG: prepilin-type N-terminal cleavage/methylation domain-containing protein [Deltaproteobacteria bacterium]|nr:prepilin-type N-terminal cleavage/methylation domain-containing protein [Deltaproteobacteria bacterium]
MISGRIQRGFTLIEMMVVVVIVAGIMTGVALSIGATDRVKLRSSCWTLVSAVRFAYSFAVTRGVTTRIVMNFENGSFHIEETKGRVVLNREDETGEGLKRQGDDRLGVDGGLGGSLLDSQMDSIGSSFGGGSGGGLSSSPMSNMGMGMGMGSGGGGTDDTAMFDMMSGVSAGQLSDPFLAMMQGGGSGNPYGYRRPKFKRLTGRRGETRELEGNTTFIMAYLPHAPTPVEEGKAYLYFFPGGVTEHSIIQLSDGDERIYSVEVHPISGRAIIHNEAVEPEEELDELQEAEE